MDDADRTDRELTSLAVDLVERESTMALATARGNVSWAAPVYFVFHGSAFYFFSDPKSRHMEEARESGQASATIYPHADTWREIRGIQMSGRIENIPPGLEAVRSIRAYLRKFPFTREFFSPGDSPDLESFGKRFNVRFYAFRPQLAYYLDNRIKFGFRKEVRLA